MYYLSRFCLICLQNRKNLRHVSTVDINGISIYTKLTSSSQDVIAREIDERRLLCERCCGEVESIYQLQRKCFAGEYRLRQYLTLLSSVGTTSGVITVQLTDCTKINIKKESHEIDNDAKRHEGLTNFDKPNQTLPQFNEHINIKTEIDCASEDQNFGTKIVDEVPENALSNGFSNIYPDDFNYRESQIPCDNIKKEIPDLEISTISEDGFEESSDPLMDLQDIKKDSDDQEVLPESNYSFARNLVDDMASRDIKKGWSPVDIVKEHLPNEDLKIGNAGSSHSEDNEVSRSGSPEFINCGENIPNKLEEINYFFQDFTCEICNAKLGSRKSLNRHGQIHTTKQHECPVCKKKFSEPHKVKRHMLVHTGEKPHSCELCGSKFTTKDNLNRHYRIHTGVKQHECDICKRKFAQVDNLKSHMLIHTGQKPYPCEVCGVKFRQSSNLKIHMRLHTGQRPHQCEICNCKFDFPSRLHKHMLVHTGAKPFSCEVCNMNFRRVSNLKVHMKIHSQNKIYECNLCYKKFRQAKKLWEHKAIHAEVKPHSCNACGMKFKQIAGLNKHMRVHIKLE